MGDIWHSIPASTQPESAAAWRTPHAARTARADAAASAHLELVESSQRVLAGRYQIEGAIGSGAMGTVFRARDRQLNSLCAIKMLHHKALRDEADFQRFINEATLIAQLFHPNIVEVREFRRDERGGPFLVMELLHGIDLHSHLVGGRKLPLDRVQLVVRQVASALHAAHSQGIIHRDIKPRNIFLAQQSGTAGGLAEIVKVVDFGLSKSRGGQQPQTAPGEILGTPEYLAPEGTIGRSSLIDERTDQWALAITAYRMLAGQLPFVDEDVVRLMLKIRQSPLPLLSSYAVQVPDYVTQALARALSKRKEDRFPSVLDFARALYGLPASLAVARPEPQPWNAATEAPASRSSALPGRSKAPLLTPEQERQIEQLEQTQPIAQQVLDDLLGLSSSAGAPDDGPRWPALPADGVLRPAPEESAGAAQQLERRVGAPRRRAAGRVLFPLLALATLIGLGAVGGRLWPARRPSHAPPVPRAATALSDSVARLAPVPPAQAEAAEDSPAAAFVRVEEDARSAVDLTSRVGRDEKARPQAINAGAPALRRSVPGMVHKPGAADPLRPDGPEGPAGMDRRAPPATAPPQASRSPSRPGGPPLVAAPPAATRDSRVDETPAKEILAKETLPKEPPAPEPTLPGSADPLPGIAAGASSPPRTAPATAPVTAPAIVSRRPERLSGVDPQLPTWAHSVLGRDPVSGSYLICIGRSGAVERVSILASIPPADEVIIQALRTWRYPPRAGSLCFQQELHFMITS